MCHFFPDFVFLLLIHKKKPPSLEASVLLVLLAGIELATY
jgi:hypothetical protein